MSHVFNCYGHRTLAAVSPKHRKWVVNGTMFANERLDAFFVDPSAGNVILLEKIENGQYPLLIGPRASGKSTRVMCVMEELHKKGYICL